MSMGKHSMVRKQIGTPTPSQDELVQAVRELTVSMNALRISNEPQNNFKLSMAYSFLKAVAYVLGALMTVALLVPLLLLLLRGVEWPPLIGDWVAKVITQIEEAQRSAR